MRQVTFNSIRQVNLRRALLSLVAFFTIFASMAQTRVSGTVYDSTGEPVIGASVLVKGQTLGVSTDIDGNFTIGVDSPDAILVISYVGCQTVEVHANAKDLDHIVLRDSENLLDEMVVIGYGAVKKSDATGSVTAIKPDELNKGNRVSVQDAMVGKIAGVNVVSAGGAPGEGATIRIRSGASLSASNDPLFVIDGVPVDNSSIEGATNLIGGINPDDIETFTVLKDASATAIYGSRASNGVIVITTKRGADKLSVSYNGSFSVSTRTKTLDNLSADDYRAFIASGAATGVPTDTSLLGTASTDWEDEIYRTAYGTNHDLSINGKANGEGFFSGMPYRVSASYNSQEGIIKNNRYQRFTGNVALSPSWLNNHLSMNLNAKLSYEKDNQIDKSVVGNALRYDPTRPVMASSYDATTPGLGYFIWKNGDSPMAIQTDNPVATIDLDQRVNKVTRSIGNAQFDYKIHGFEDLRLNLNLGYDVLESRYDRDVPQYAGMMYTGNQKDGTSLIFDGKQKKHNYLLDAYANYTHCFAEKHDVSVMAGYGWQHFWRKYDYTQNGVKPGSPTLEELATPYHFESEYYLLSLYGRVNYSYASRILLTATLRADASSRFAKNNRWGYFPSVALAYRLMEEDFMKNQTVLSDLKIRLGYGVTGQQDILNDYPYMTTFSISYPESSYKFGDTWYETYRPNGFDSNIKWETTTTWNAGIDYGFFNNRIYGSIEYYKRFTKDLLNTISAPSGTNYAAVITTNVGEMENQGVEFSFNAIPVQTKDWEWNIGFNYTWQDSKITKLNVVDTESNFVSTGSISGTGKYVQCFMVGQTPYTFYLAQQAYDSNGKPLEGQYIQEDGSIGTTEYRVANKHSALPTGLLGFNTRVSYKNLDLSIAGHGSFGNWMYNYVKADQYLQSCWSDQGSYSNLLQSTVDTGFQTQQLYSDYWLEDASFFRIDNITIGYTFRHLWSKSSSLRLSANVSNVCTFTSYSGVDPEIYSGIDREVYPRPRTFTIGLNLNF